LTDYAFGSGPTHIVFVGGIHGGYEWNTILLAYDMIDHLAANPAFIPADVTVHIIPAANPDGQYLVTGQESRFTPLDVAADSLPGRINGRGVSG
jgi:predicted deacylase